MSYDLKTVNGYDFYEVASVVQKSIRRGDKLYASYFALELFASGYSKYLWKRLLTISAEDCYGVITKEIWSLYEAFKLVNEKTDKEKGRIFITKAVILLCDCPKSRESDHLQCFSYDKGVLIEDCVIKELLLRVTEQDRLEVPEYTYDVHTRKGKKMGKTKEQFFVEEHNALNNRQPSLFDSLF